MSQRDDQRLDAVERRLADRAVLSAPPGHRDRVLAAVRDALPKKVPATISGQSPQGDCPVSPDLVAGTGIDAGGRAALVALALSASLVIVAPWVGATRPAAPVPTEPRTVAQARAAWIDLPVAAVAAPGDLRREPDFRAGAGDLWRARRHEVRRMRILIEGEL